MELLYNIYYDMIYKSNEIYRNYETLKCLNSINNISDNLLNKEIKNINNIKHKL